MNGTLLDLLRAWHTTEPEAFAMLAWKDMDVAYSIEKDRTFGHHSRALILWYTLRAIKARGWLAVRSDGWWSVYHDPEVWRLGATEDGTGDDECDATAVLRAYLRAVEAFKPSEVVG